ncbi:KamA family radical SAM protein [Candidatus Nitrosarchaeum limnium]|jgi:KamA family protein|uniref:KamA family protein n=1 Tax=Candidatus Nitrosarchaeum limnium BG20 TaxID=859192 RepID=S2E5P6_9ARCH|nr:lysine 2,3-aminomutase [Candidatus Nitrosarchaeum limnium]EPA06043.1 KamA family protein [Candidatus Nitrosarchaeum limnium BG20]
MQRQDSVWSVGESPRIKSYTLVNFRELPQIQKMGAEKQFEMEVVGNVLPFKTNNYVIEQLIDWNNIPNDPMFVLTFPQRGMLIPEHYSKMESALKKGDKKEIQNTANEIRLQLNPHPAGQMELNVPTLKDGTKLHGMQHKYQETCLFFPSQSQTCHAYCSFCFRWPQFVGMDELKFAMREGEQLVQYLREHPEISDVLFTGGDPMIMKAKVFSTYINPLLEANLPNLRTIRIGTKALSYWPYKFLTDDDAEEMLEIFKRVIDKGIHLAVMGHFNHLVELKTNAVKEAIKKIRATGAQIRTQSPLLRHINDDADMWAEMWKTQVQLGCIPYYMFVVRDTGAQHYFGISLVDAQRIFRDAYKKVTGLARTVRGPSMSATPGKIQILGITELNNEKFMVLRFLQGRNPDWVQIPFLAKYDEKAIWLDDLKPATGDKFFFEDELKEMMSTIKIEDYPES